jgi:hypothetical protein
VKGIKKEEERKKGRKRKRKKEKKERKRQHTFPGFALESVLRETARKAFGSICLK